MEQRACIKFCVKSKIKSCDVVKMVETAFGDTDMSKATVCRWYNRFMEGREDINADDRAGRPSTSTTEDNLEKIKDLVLENRRITVREVEEEVGISYGSCEAIMVNTLGLRCVAAKMVPKLRSFLQREQRRNAAQDCLNAVADDPTLLQRVVAGVESWVYGYDAETKAQSSEWRRPEEGRPKKTRQVKSPMTLLLTVFFDHRGVVYPEFLPYGQTVNKEYYLEVLRRLRELIRRKRPQLWKDQSWILHHENAPPHTALIVRDTLAKGGTTVLSQPPYSPDLAPCDFFLFPRMKSAMKGNRYATIEELKSTSQELLKAISQTDWKKCFDDWKVRWKKCVLSGGAYFEGDHINISD